MKTIQELRRDLQAQLDPFFYPDSIAIIGASQNMIKPSGIPLNLLTLFDYAGEIYPINPKYGQLGGRKCYPSIVEVPGSVDLAIIGVPAAVTLESLRQCAAKGVKAAIIFTSGFAEVGEDGRALQEEISRLARDSGMRILGPNCLGVVNFYNGSAASFMFHDKPKDLYYPETLSYITQSGGLGAIIFQMVLQHSVGCNYFVSTGNEADVNFAEVLSYLVGRDEVKLIGGYIEGLPQGGRLFMEACHEALKQRKLVTFQKVGRTAVGATAAASHTGALVGEDRVYDGVFKQFGAVRADDVEQMNALITLHAAGRLPAGKNIGVITISGGGGVVVADKCPDYGLEVVRLTETTQNSLREFFPPYGAVANPVDLTSAIFVDGALFQRAIRTVMEDPLVDMGAFFYNLQMPDLEAAEKIIDIYYSTDKPLVIFTWPTGQDYAVEAKEKMIRAGVPVVEHVPSGLWALSALADWAGRSKDVPSFPSYSPGAGREQARKVVALSTAQGRRTLTESRSKELLQAYGIPVTREILARSAAEAAAAAGSLGYPVVLKIESPDIAHKTEAGGVLLNLTDAAAVQEGYGSIMKRAREYNPSASIDGVLVQEMLSPGLEVILGVKKDPLFGPTILFGLGGIFVELLKDLSVRTAPLREEDARAMLEEIEGKALLGGVRGEQPRDREALVGIMMKLSRLAVELGGEIAELDINPLIVYADGEGAVAADALVILSDEA
ncbi:MAG: acetate--CoA ligase family protein [Dethiobacteria bacterium]|jgi:acyl-CoA synthetase (NDP forming)